MIYSEKVGFWGNGGSRLKMVAHAIFTQFHALL
jgi:hypothetical protein